MSGKNPDFSPHKYQFRQPRSMESRLNYKTSKNLSTKVNWNWQSKTKEIYCGLAQDFKRNLVEEYLNDHISGPSLYLVLTRNGSYELPFKDALTRIKELVGTNRFIVWDTNFTKAMEFNNIGVFKKGPGQLTRTFKPKRLHDNRQLAFV